MPSLTTTQRSQLKQILGAAGYSEHADELAPYLSDWRGRYHGHTPLLAKPANAKQLADVVKVCAATGVAITPQGGNTGLCGGATPQGEVLVSLQRMNALRTIDAVNDTITVEAGYVLQALHQQADAVQRYFPLSLGAQGSATVGGLIATNAGGTQVLRYGMMRDLVLGLEVVLADGTIWSRLDGLRKNNTGYDLKQWFIGAEGTLGIITAATLKLFPAPARRETAWCGMNSVADAVNGLMWTKQQCGDAVTAFELVPRSLLELVCQHLPGARDPLPTRHHWYVLCEMSFGHAHGAREILEETLSEAIQRGHISDAVIAQSDEQARQLWALREFIAEAERLHGKAVKHDIGVPVSALPAFIADLSQRIQARLPEAWVIAFGHVGDGNVHFNIASQQPGADDTFVARAQPLTQVVYNTVAEYGGTIAAEHGIGVLKNAELAARKPVDVAMMAAIKHALDPKGIMNPRVLLPPTP